MKLLREQGDNRKADLSILVCAYNHHEFIGECLDSINAVASPERFDVIIIDDGSADATLARALAYPFQPTLPVRIFAKPNAGLIDTLAQGLGLAAAPFFSPMASDDRYAPQGLDQALATCCTPALATIVTLCGADFLADSEARLRRGRTAAYGPEMAALFAASPAERLRRLSVGIQLMLLQSTVFPTDFLAASGAWRDGLELDDWPTFLKVAAAEVRGNIGFRYRPDLTLSEYRLHGGGMNTNIERMTRFTLQVARTAVEPRYRTQCVGHIHRRDTLAWLARGDLARAWASYRQAIAVDPGVDTFLATPMLAARGLARRVARQRPGSA